MNVLLVEDSDDLRTLYACLLRRRGVVVREAADGREAFAAAQASRPDVVVTDLMMPVMDGYELIRRLREAPGMEAVPIVAVTADATPEAERRARAADLLVKPVGLLKPLDRIRPPLPA